MASYEKGDSDDDVTQIQTALGVATDGEFGAATVKAVKAWQSAQGMKADGMVGPDMLLALGLTDLVLLENGDEGDLVRRVQELVGVEADGEYGDATMKAVRAYQKSNGLKADGIAGRKTLDRMGFLSGEPSAAPSSRRPAREPEPVPPPRPAPIASAPVAPASASTATESTGKSWWPWSRSAPEPTAPPASAGGAASGPIASWAYQIADVDAKDIASLSVDLAVVDYARDGDEDTAFKPADLKRMKQRPGGGIKKVVSYMSIGEAEDYRYYWQDAWKTPAGKPAWLDDLNPDWEGNYKVRFWDPEWQGFIFGNPNAYLDKILAAGFDGVYLDIIDAFEYWRDTKSERPSADQDMIAFVGRIAAYARARNPGFLIIPQNGEALLEDATYRSIISIQAKEDIFYGADGDGKVNTKTAVTECLGYLAYARQAGIPIIAVEYLDENGQRSEAKKKLGETGCVAYFGPRDLASIPKEQFS